MTFVKERLGKVGEREYEIIDGLAHLPDSDFFNKDELPFDQPQGRTETQFFNAILDVEQEKVLNDTKERDLKTILNH